MPRKKNKVYKIMKRKRNKIGTFVSNNSTLNDETLELDDENDELEDDVQEVELLNEELNNILNEVLKWKDNSTLENKLVMTAKNLSRKQIKEIVQNKMK